MGEKKNLFRRAIDAMIESRMRQAERYVAGIRQADVFDHPRNDKTL